MHIFNKKAFLVLSLAVATSAGSLVYAMDADTTTTSHADADQRWYSFASLKGYSSKAWSYLPSKDQVKAYWAQGKKEKAIIVGGSAAVLALLYVTAQKCRKKKTKTITTPVVD